MIRRLFLAAFAALALMAVSCEKQEDPKEVLENALEGIWELSGVATKSAQIGSTKVDVYIVFTEGSFTLYQKIGAGRFTKFTGTYKLGDDLSLSGSYADGKAWGPYEIVIEGTSMTLSKGTETDTYNKIDAVPDAVLSNVYPQ